MELQTLLSFEEKDPLHFLQFVRRDPEKSTQIYLYYVTERDGQMHLSFFQSLWDGAQNQTALFRFFHGKYEKSAVEVEMERWAIDERSKVLYLMLGNFKKLEIYDFNFESKDSRISICRKTCIVLNDQHFVPRIPYPPLLTSCIGLPVSRTGQLLGQIVTVRIDTAPFSETAFFALPLKCDQAKKRCLPAIPVPTPNEFEFLSPRQSFEIGGWSYIFTSSDHLVVLFSVTQRPERFIRQAILGKQPCSDDDRCFILHSYAKDGKLSNTLKADSAQFVKSFLPNYVFNQFLGQIPQDMEEYMFFGMGLRLLGHVHKYVVFSFNHNFILAAKWPNNWHLLSQLPDIHPSRTKVIRVDKQKKFGEISNSCLIDTDLYFVCKKVIRKMSLDRKFKDYRRCAFCGKIEEKKKKNKAGKRVSSFKVCRKCKELKFHRHYDAKSACHYCSDECQKKDWKAHKSVHKASDVE